MQNTEVLSIIKANKIIAVLTIPSADLAVPLARCLLANGIKVMELTLRTVDALDSLKLIKAEVPEMLAGVGTVLTTQQIIEVKKIGADFAVSPGFNPVVVKCALEEGLFFAPGIATPSDIEGAVELGCCLLKYFPAESSGGVKHLISMSAPYNHLGLEYIPLGGITLTNMLDYLKTGLVPAVGGSWIAKTDLIVKKNWDVIGTNARNAVTILDNLNLKRQGNE